MSTKTTVKYSNQSIKPFQRMYLLQLTPTSMHMPRIPRR